MIKCGHGLNADLVMFMLKDRDNQDLGKFGTQACLISAQSYLQLNDADASANEAEFGRIQRQPAQYLALSLTNTDK